MTSKALVIADTVHNIGDLALLQQVIFGLRSFAGIDDFAVRQWAMPDKAIAQQFSQADCRLGSSKWQFAYAPGRMPVVGGGQFIRDNVSISYLLFMLFTLTTARRPAVALAVGGVRVRRGLRKWLWRAVLARFSLITFRDATSRSLVEDMLPRGKNHPVTCDLALLLSPLAQKLGHGVNEHRVIVAPCHDAGEDRLIDAAWTARTATSLAGHYQARQITVLPHDDRADVDRPICTRIVREMADDSTLTVQQLMTPSLDTALEQYSTAAVVLTNRLHAMIFALLAGKPVFVIDDGNPKLKAFAQRFMVQLLPQDGGERMLESAIAREQSAVTQTAREQALAQARVEAAWNFELLRIL